MDVDVTAAAQAVVTALRAAGPTSAVVGIVILFLFSGSSRGRARLRLAALGLSGQARHGAWRQFVAALVLPAIALSVLTVSLSLESEVRQGPNRMIDRLVAGIGQSSQPRWILQSGTEHFMNDSRIAGGAQVVEGSTDGLALWSELAEIHNTTSRHAGLILAPAQPATPSQLAPLVDRGSAECTVIHGRCLLGDREVVADTDLGPVGATVTVRDVPLRIVAHPAQPVSLLNRAVVFAAPDLLRTAAGELPDPYAILIRGPNAQARAEAFVEASGLSQVEVLSTDEISRANSEFWAGNATPLILLVIAMTAVFCGVALYGTRRTAQEQARVQIGTLRAMGLTPARAASVDLTRTLLVTVAAALSATPAAVAVISATNAGILGFHARVEVGDIAASAGLIVLADLVGTAVLWQRLRRASIVEAISGA